MNDDESSYYEMRAEEALDLAQQAVHPAAVRAHYGMAELYIERMLDSRAKARGISAPALF
jgi:hypothetical protein